MTTEFPPKPHINRPLYKAIKKRGVDSAALARRLIELNEHQRNRLNLPEFIRETLDEYFKIPAKSSHGARKRQERRLAGHLRNVESDEIFATIEGVQKSSLADARLFQKLEFWRKALVDDEGGYAKLTERYALDDEVLAALKTHVDDAQSEKRTSKPKGASKKLFRFLRENIGPLF